VLTATAISRVSDKVSGHHDSRSDQIRASSSVHLYHCLELSNGFARINLFFRITDENVADLYSPEDISVCHQNL